MTFNERYKQIRQLSVVVIVILILSVQVLIERKEQEIRYNRIQQLASAYAVLIANPDGDVVLKSFDPPITGITWNELMDKFSGGSVLEGLFQIDGANKFEISGTVRHPNGSVSEFRKLTKSDIKIIEKVKHVGSLYSDLGLPEPSLFPMEVGEKFFVFSNAFPMYNGLGYENVIANVVYGLDPGFDFPDDGLDVGTEIQEIAQTFGVFEDDPNASLRKVGQLWKTKTVSIPIINTKVSATYAIALLFCLASAINLVVAGQLRIMANNLPEADGAADWAMLDGRKSDGHIGFSDVSHYIERGAGYIFYGVAPAVSVILGIMTLYIGLDRFLLAVVSLLVTDLAVMCSSYIQFHRVRSQLLDLRLVKS